MSAVLWLLTPPPGSLHSLNEVVGCWFLLLLLPVAAVSSPLEGGGSCPGGLPLDGPELDVLVWTTAVAESSSGGGNLPISADRPPLLLLESDWQKVVSLGLGRLGTSTRLPLDWDWDKAGLKHSLEFFRDFGNQIRSSKEHLATPCPSVHNFKERSVNFLDLSFDIHLSWWELYYQR